MEAALVDGPAELQPQQDVGEAHFNSCRQQQNRIGREVTSSTKLVECMFMVIDVLHGEWMNGCCSRVIWLPAKQGHSSACKHSMLQQLQHTVRCTTAADVCVKRHSW
jgi:hypothetical protein